jgi:preprotein translocase subunit SecD
MDKSTRWRTLTLALLLIVAVCALIPNLVDRENLPGWFPFKSKINLGLDLKGGTHMVYSIDLDKAVDDKASEVKRDLEAKLSDLGIKARVSTPATPVGAVTIRLENAADKARIDSKFMSDYDEFLVSRDCPAADVETARCFRVSSNYADSIKEAALKQAVTTITERIDEKGIAEPSVIPKGDQIIVELPGLDPDTITRVKDIISRTAKLEFKIVDENNPWMSSLYAKVNGDPAAQAAEITAKQDDWVHEGSGKQFIDFYLHAPKEKRAILTPEEAKQRDCLQPTKNSNGTVECTITGRAVIEDYLTKLAATDPTFKVPDDHQIGYELITPAPDEDNQRAPYWRTYFLHRAVELTGSSVQDSYVFYDPTTNRPEVLIDFNRYGGRRFGDLTAANVGRKMAIILDDRVNSAPTIQAAIRGGRSTISMGGSDPTTIKREADDLVAVLKTGSLPAPLTALSANDVGPMLGLDAVEKAKLSFGLGSLIVILIMIGIYRFSGTISVIAMLINILLMLFSMTVLGATLSLPGIAALVLTVGLAVDGNIIIYERVREELTAGKSVRGAVDAGFSRAFTTVLDGHLTTAAAGWVLLEYGSGPIRGFATMLLIGIATTLFTTIWCTRLFFDYYLGRGRKEQISI